MESLFINIPHSLEETPQYSLLPINVARAGHRGEAGDGVPVRVQSLQPHLLKPHWTAQPMEDTAACTSSCVSDFKERDTPSVSCSAKAGQTLSTGQQFQPHPLPHHQHQIHSTIWYNITTTTPTHTCTTSLHCGAHNNKKHDKLTTATTGWPLGWGAEQTKCKAQPCPARPISVSPGRASP